MIWATYTIVHVLLILKPKILTVYNSLVDFFTYVTSEHSVRWLPNYKQHVNGIIRQVEDQKVENKRLMKVLVAR